MIVERGTFFVREGQEAAFEAAFADAAAIAREAPGCLSIELARGIEQPSTYLVLIEWTSVEAHIRDFRESEAFQEWAALLRPHYAAIPEGEHYQPVARS